MKRALKPYSREHVVFIILIILGGIGLYIGWQLFWFLTDDAFIAFRYVSNSILGRGYVWNIPPFRPVEGYTSFLWVVVLDLVWRLFGEEPPQSSNILSLAFSFGTLVLTMLMIMKIPISDSLRKFRLAFVALSLSFLLLNRTFLAWSSSGLETGMFTFFTVLWVYILLFVDRLALKVGLGSLISAFLALSRPDGLLTCAAMIPIIFLAILRTPRDTSIHKLMLWGILPLLIPVAHEAWRLSFYGEWFPNTFYAKVTGTWVESGIRYVFSFILEYALWFALIPICVALVMTLLKARFWVTQYTTTKERLPILREFVATYGIQFTTIATILASFFYYTFVVGGDHFEYRIYNHLIPFSFLALVWSLDRLKLHPLPALGLTLGFVLLSLPVQWTHWALTKDLNTRQQTYVMVVPITPSWPTVMHWYSQPFDDAQRWLISHSVGMRHQEHKVFWQTQVEEYPPREEGLKIPPDGYPVFANGSVGVPSWTLPNVNILDTLGLNDYVVARTPVPDGVSRQMAHDRLPPEGYVDSYSPNVIIDARKPIVIARHPEMTSDDVSKIEASWWDRLKRYGFASSISVPGALLPPQLVTNHNFEQGFSDYSLNSSEPGEVANAWKPFIISGRPTFRDTAAMNPSFVSKIDGADSQTIWSWGNPFVAGIYQRVPRVEPGHIYTAWYATSGAYINGEPPGLQRTIGIDPLGGSDPASPQIVWGNTYDDTPWATKELGNAPTVSVVAKNSTITLFIKVTSTATNQQAYQAFIDGVVMVNTGVSNDNQPLRNGTASLVSDTK